MITSEFLKNHLGLQPLPGEGGFFIETYRSKSVIPAAVLPQEYAGDRAVGTAIYYLITRENFSAMHMLPGDEIFHFYLGSPVQMLQLHPDGRGELTILGPELDKGMVCQVRVPGLTWQGSRLLESGEFALLGTTMAPGFDFADFNVGTRDALTARYAIFAKEIASLTPGTAA
jgi:predicted cupin superfamily sugar epimerase